MQTQQEANLSKTSQQDGASQRIPFSKFVSQRAHSGQNQDSYRHVQNQLVEKNHVDTLLMQIFVKI